MFAHKFPMVLASVVITAYVHAQSKSTKSYSPCQRSGTTIVETERLPERPMSRDIETTKGDRTVTVIDGYRFSICWIQMSRYSTSRTRRWSTVGTSNSKQIWWIC